jgi:hypothetical protein
MSDQEREAARLGMRVLDNALIALGHRPALENPDFRAAEPVVGDLPNIVLEKAGVAPLRFIFGQQLDVWVGPFSEIVTVDISHATKDDAQATCRIGKRSVEIALQLPGNEPWLRLKVVGGSGAALTLEPTYAPYAG